MNLAQITVETIAVVQRAGAFIRAEAEKFSSESIEYKATNNVVSYVDKEAEKRLVEGLKEVCLEAGFITEEGTVAQADQNQLNWIIDPLDGTANFVHGLPVYCVSVALVQNKQPIVGVVYHLGTNELFYAWKEGGAYLILDFKSTILDFNTIKQGGRRLNVSSAKTLSASLLATGFPYYQFEKQPQYLKILESLMQRTHGLRRMGAAAIDLAYVAMGRFEAFYEYNLQPWDMAAGILLIQEAGGIVTDFAGNNDYLFGGDIVAGSAVQPELLGVIQEFWI